jgi:hypothetical protein
MGRMGRLDGPASARPATVGRCLAGLKPRATEARRRVPSIPPFKPSVHRTAFLWVDRDGEDGPTGRTGLSEAGYSGAGPRGGLASSPRRGGTERVPSISAAEASAKEGPLVKPSEIRTVFCGGVNGSPVNFDENLREQSGVVKSLPLSTLELASNRGCSDYAPVAQLDRAPAF